MLVGSGWVLDAVKDFYCSNEGSIYGLIAGYYTLGMELFVFPHFVPVNVVQGYISEEGSSNSGYIVRAEVGFSCKL